MMIIRGWNGVPYFQTNPYGFYIKNWEVSSDQCLKCEILIRKIRGYHQHTEQEIRLKNQKEQWMY